MNDLHSLAAAFAREQAAVIAFPQPLVIKGGRDLGPHCMRTFACVAAVVAGFAMLLTACGSQTAGDIQAQHRGRVYICDRPVSSL